MDIWEKIELYQGASTHRMNVPGGWVIKTCYWSEDLKSVSTALVFVPDAIHKWKLPEGE